MIDTAQKQQKQYQHTMKAANTLQEMTNETLQI